jgi:hypothetical protein
MGGRNLGAEKKNSNNEEKKSKEYIKPMHVALRYRWWSERYIHAISIPKTHHFVNDEFEAIIRDLYFILRVYVIEIWKRGYIG